MLTVTPQTTKTVASTMIASTSNRTTKQCLVTGIVIICVHVTYFLMNVLPLYTTTRLSHYRMFQTSKHPTSKIYIAYFVYRERSASGAEVRWNQFILILIVCFWWLLSVLTPSFRITFQRCVNKCWFCVFSIFLVALTPSFVPCIIFNSLSPGWNRLVGWKQRHLGSHCQRSYSFFW